MNKILRFLAVCRFKKLFASDGSQTQVYYLEGNYPNCWTTNAFMKSITENYLLFCFTAVAYNCLALREEDIQLKNNVFSAVLLAIWDWEPLNFDQLKLLKSINFIRKKSQLET
jgi:hypothetical protein